MDSASLEGATMIPEGVTFIPAQPEAEDAVADETRDQLVRSQVKVAVEQLKIKWPLKRVKVLHTGTCVCVCVCVCVTACV